MIGTAENFMEVYCGMSRKDACENLQVSDKAMKRIMNYYGITKWPSKSEQERHRHRRQQREAAETAAASSEL